MAETEHSMIQREADVLRIVLPPRLDGKNAASVSQEIWENLDETVKTVTFDAKSLRYISPDGLDVILDVKKKYRDVTVENARMGICDTLEAYGFDRFVGIGKQYRFLSIKGCKVIGEGGHGAIYQIGDDSIIKVYKDNSTIEEIERERRFARNAFMHGVSTPITYDVVQTENGLGVMFEMLNGMTLGKYLALHPEKFDEYSTRFADLIYKMNTTPADGDLYPDIFSVYMDRAERAKKFIGEEGGETLKRILSALPKGSGMIHGDYHPNNVMIDSAGELMIIDMADISRGNGFYDIGGTYLVLRFIPRVFIVSFLAKRICSLSPKMCLKLWDVLLRRYYGTEDEKQLALYNERCRAFAMLRIVCTLGMASSRPAIVDRLMALFFKIFVAPKEKKYIEIFSGMQS